MKIRIGLIGLGTVGSGVISLLDKHREFFRDGLGFDFTAQIGLQEGMRRTVAFYEEKYGHQERSPA